ncbi:sensor domain-containing phosphodiesterase [Pantoea sp. FN0307]|uniref:sensor domain-containing phosphodiesterase n=1 Tax=unclassified Pantoea TaxID=2630326 RepID=UPI003CFAD228
MLSPLQPLNSKRRAALELLKKNDRCRDEILSQFTLLTSQLLGIPSCYVSILDEERQYIKAPQMFPLMETSLQHAFCRHTIQCERLLICPDTWQDPRFEQHPLTRGAPFIRFYAGAPLISGEDDIIGTLCVTDTQPRTFSEEQQITLATLARLAAAFLDAWYANGYIDTVTGLPNRQRLLRDLELSADMLPDQQWRLLMIDCIDPQHIFDVSRSLGIAASEGLLHELTRVLYQRLSLHDKEPMLYLINHGRFALLTHSEEGMDSKLCSEKLGGINACLGDTITIDLQVRVGEVQFSPRTLPPLEAMRRALSALHEAIAQQNLFQLFDSENDQRRNQEFQRLNDLARAVRGRYGLYLVYQPKICLHTGKTVGLEALLRWNHPVEGEIPPGRFIPLAAGTSLMAELTDWVLDSAIRQLQRWAQKGIHLPVSVNVSVSDICRPDFADRQEERLLRCGLTPEYLGIECLETEEIHASPNALHGFDMLKLRGFKISLDDFGSGYSNISYLRRIPIDVIKLDRSLISRLQHDTASGIIVRNVISMLKDLDYVVLAEGVEDKETYEQLQSLGCDEVQGFYCSAPMKATALERWLQQ